MSPDTPCGSVTVAVRLQAAAMSRKITKILLVLAILQHGLRADPQAAKATEEVQMQHEEQQKQGITWTAVAGAITKILIVAGIFQYALSVDLPAVKVTEDLLRRHEEQRSQEMAKLQSMEQRMEEQPRPTKESVLVSTCQEWWFWDCVEIVLTLFGIYLMPMKWRGDSDRDSAQEQMEEEEDREPSEPMDLVDTSSDSALSTPETTF